MLVSNARDDVFNTDSYLSTDEAGPGADGLPKNGYTWKSSDRTHRVALRGTVRAAYTPTVGLPVLTSAPVPVTKNVKAHVTILKDTVGGAQFLTLAQANEKIHLANEQYAQVGILLVPSFQAIDPPPGVLLGDGLDINAGVLNGVVTPTIEEATLLSANRTAAQDDIEVYIINFFIPNGDDGEAFPARYVPHSRYEDSIIIRHNASPLVYAHEIGHILTDFGHYTGSLKPINLMVNHVIHDDLVTDSKRLLPSQQTDMLSKRPNLLTGP